MIKKKIVMELDGKPVTGAEENSATESDNIT